MKSKRTWRHVPPPRPTAEEWPRWDAALNALQMQARFAAATLAAMAGNPPRDASYLTGLERKAMQKLFAAYDAECKHIARMLMTGCFDTPETHMTIPELTPERLLNVWVWPDVEQAQVVLSAASRPSTI